jgi:hypothetical protein
MFLPAPARHSGWTQTHSRHATEIIDGNTQAQRSLLINQDRLDGRGRRKGNRIDV